MSKTFYNRAAIPSVLYCEETNLPCFKDVIDAMNWLATAERNYYQTSWTCSACGFLHAEFSDPAKPSGSSSGTGRERCQQVSTELAKTLSVRSNP